MIAMTNTGNCKNALLPLVFFFLVILSTPTRCEMVNGVVFNDVFDGEWGSLFPVKIPRRLGIQREFSDFNASFGILKRENIISEYSNGTRELDERLVFDYFAELQYDTSDNVVVFRPEGQDDSALQRAYANMRIRLKNTKYNDVRPGPKVYYIPKNASILSKTVKDLNAAGRHYLIRGGGHSYEANTLPSSDETAVIDMARFTSIEVSESEMVGNDGITYRELVFGPGLRLATIYLFLAMRNLALVAGTCPANGSSGYYLGGGAGPSMRKVGWGSDQIVRAKVVMPDGSLAVADSDDTVALPGQTVPPSDLLYALRGGGAGTTIVYEYTLRVYPAPERISRCQMDFMTQTKEQYQMFVNGWSNDWKIWELDGNQYPFIRIYSKFNASYIVMDSWTESVDDVATYIKESMSSAQDLFTGDPVCQSYTWLEFLHTTFADYYKTKPEIMNALGNWNYTIPGLLAMDYIGWGYAGSDLRDIRPPLSPYADFQADAPTVNGPNSFTAQGIVSSKAWDSSVAGGIWDEAISKGLKFYSYVLGGRLKDTLRGASADDSIGAAIDALMHGIIMTVTDASPTNQEEIDQATAVADILDSNTVSKQPSRYYNFINCYNNTDASTLFEMYYGDEVSARLVDIKKRADPQSRLKTWCDI